MTQTTATAIAAAFNASDIAQDPDGRGTGIVAKVWSPSDASWSRVYFETTSRARRKLGFVQVSADGTVRSELTKQRSTIVSAIEALGFKVQ